MCHCGNDMLAAGDSSQVDEATVFLPALPGERANQGQENSCNMLSPIYHSSIAGCCTPSKVIKHFEQIVTFVCMLSRGSIGCRRCAVDRRNGAKVISL